MVVLKGNLSPVVEIAVGFNHQPFAGPQEVDEIWTDRDVDLGPWQPMAATQAQEVTLQVAASPVLGVLGADRQAEYVCLADRFA